MTGFYVRFSKAKWTVFSPKGMAAAKFDKKEQAEQEAYRRNFEADPPPEKPAIRTAKRFKSIMGGTA